MKKFLCGGLCLLMILGVMTCFTACDHSSKSETYYLYEVDGEDGKYTAQDLQKDLDAEGSGLKLEDAFYLTLHEDGTAVFCNMGIETAMQYNAQELWQADNPDAKISYTRSGDTLVVRDGDATMTFKKK